MAGQNAVFDAAALEREAHVRAAVVERKNAPVVVDDEDRTMAPVHDEPLFCLQFLERARSGEFLRVHEKRSSFRAAAGGPANAT